MNSKKKDWAPYKRIAIRLKKVLEEGPVIDGTLSNVNLGSSIRYQLTRKVKGRTKTVYVPSGAAEEVADWTGRWRDVRNLLKEMSEFSRRVFPSMLAKTKATGKGSSPSRAAVQRKSLTTSYAS